jgi:hypothetical protein
MTIRIVQVGAGIRGRHWAGFVRRHADFRCVALVEPEAAIAACSATWRSCRGATRPTPRWS